MFTPQQVQLRWDYVLQVLKTWHAHGPVGGHRTEDLALLLKNLPLEKQEKQVALMHLQKIEGCFANQAVNAAWREVVQFLEMLRRILEARYSTLKLAIPEFVTNPGLPTTPPVAPPCRKRATHDLSMVANQEAVVSDWGAAFQALRDGKLARHAGSFVAIHDGDVVDVGGDSLAVRKRAAEQRQVDDDRIVVMYVDGGETYCLS